MTLERQPFYSLPGMYKYVVEESRCLRGKTKPPGNKNAALPCIAATLLTDEPVVLRNVPEIEDVHVILDILRTLGSTIEKLGKGEYCIQTTDIVRDDIPAELAQRIRASILAIKEFLYQFNLI